MLSSFGKLTYNFNIHNKLRSLSIAKGSFFMHSNNKRILFNLKHSSSFYDYDHIIDTQTLIIFNTKTNDHLSL